MATAVVHIRHGADLVLILLVTAWLGGRIPSRHRRSLILTALTLSVGALAVVRRRHIESGGREWLEVCRTASPFHCDANSWSWGLLLTGAVAIALALGLAAGRHRHGWPVTVPTVVLPAVGVTLAVVADRLDVPVLGELAQKSNAYRLASLVLPPASGIGRPLQGRVRPGRYAVFIGATAMWLAGDSASPSSLGRDVSTMAAAGVVAVAVWALWILAKPAVLTPDGVRLALPVVAILAAMILFQGGIRPIAFGYAHHDPAVAASLELRE